MIENLNTYIITQMILEYRASAETISKMFNMDIEEIYNIAMGAKDHIVKYALLYVLDYETKEDGLVNQDEVKKQVRSFLTKFHLAKTPKEKLEIIKGLDNLSEISKLKNKRSVDMNDNDIETILNYRYKYVLSKRQIAKDFDIGKNLLDIRENKITGNMKQRIDFMNEYNKHISVEMMSRRK